MSRKLLISIIIVVSVAMATYFIWNSQKVETLKTAEEIQMKIQRLENLLDRLQEDTQKAEEGEVACILIYAPVCGADGKTYSNDCFASAAGIEIVYQGECR